LLGKKGYVVVVVVVELLEFGTTLNPFQSGVMVTQKKRQLFHWDYLHRLKIGKGRERDERGGEDMFAGLL